MDKKLKKKEERRSQIVEAAVICFIEKGLHQTGIRDIAKQAGVSLGNLYNHFSGKEDLIEEIARLEGEGLAVFISTLNASADDHKTALPRFIDNYLAYCCQIENTVLTIEILAEALRSPHIAEQFELNKSELTTALQDFLKRGMDADQFANDLDPTETSKLIVETIEGLAMRCGLENSTPSVTAKSALHRMILKTVIL